MKFSRVIVFTKPLLAIFRTFWRPSWIWIREKYWLSNSCEIFLKAIYGPNLVAIRWNLVELSCLQTEILSAAILAAILETDEANMPVFELDKFDPKWHHSTKFHQYPSTNAERRAGNVTYGRCDYYMPRFHWKAGHKNLNFNRHISLEPKNMSTSL